MTAVELIETARMDSQYLELLNKTASERQTVSAEETALQKISRIKNPLYRLLLVRRGIYAEPWDQLAGELYYSKRQLYRIYNAALAQLQYELDSGPN